MIRIWRDGRPFQLQIGETDLVRKTSYKLALECIKEHAWNPNITILWSIWLLRTEVLLFTIYVSAYNEQPEYGKFNYRCTVHTRINASKYLSWKLVSPILYISSKKSTVYPSFLSGSCWNKLHRKMKKKRSFENAPRLTSGSLSGRRQGTMLAGSFVLDPSRGKVRSNSSVSWRSHSCRFGLNWFHTVGMSLWKKMPSTIGESFTDTTHAMTSTIHCGLMTTMSRKNSVSKNWMDPRSCRNWTDCLTWTERRGKHWKVKKKYGQYNRWLRSTYFNFKN